MLDVQVVGEVEEVVKTGCWVGDCFIYTNSVNRLNYYVGGELVTIGMLCSFYSQKMSLLAKFDFILCSLFRIISTMI